MTLKIHSRLKILSHDFGKKALLPRSSIALTVYPCCLQGEDLWERSKKFELKLDCQDFYRDFTWELDYEKGTIRVFGKTELGWIEYWVYKNENALVFELKRYPETSLKGILNGHKWEALLKTPVKLFEETLPCKASIERLSFGVSKKPDLHRIETTKEMKEVMPYLFTLGRSLNLPKNEDIATTFEPLKAYLGAEGKDKELLLTKLLIGFYEGAFVPSLLDPYHCGFNVSSKPSVSPLYLTQAIAQTITDMLFVDTQDSLSILPKLWGSLVAGKASGLNTSKGKLDLEWTKGFLRQARLEVFEEGSWNLNFPKKVKTFRVTFNKKPYVLKNHFEPGVYLFDRFEA